MYASGLDDKRPTRKYFKVEIIPVFDDFDFYYKVVVSEEVEGSAGGCDFEVLDILHFNSFKEAAQFLCDGTGDASRYAEWSN